MEQTDTEIERFNRLVNTITGQGTAADVRLQSRYSTVVQPIQDSELEAIYHTNDLAKTIIDRIVEDALRNDPEVFVNKGVETALIEQESKKISKDILTKYNVTSAVTKAAIWGRLYGCGAIFLGIEDNKPMSEPLELPIKRGSLKFLEVLDKQNISTATYYDAVDVKKLDNVQLAGLPKTYSVQFTRSQSVNSVTIHESRLIFFGGADTSSRIKATNDYCDLSELQDKLEILKDIDATWYAAQDLIQAGTIGIYKIEDLANKIASNSDALHDRLRITDMLKSLRRSVVVDKEEDYTQIGIGNMSGVADLLDKFMTRLAAAARMPLTVLMGVSPAGLNATGEHDAINWFNQVQSFQKKQLEPRLNELMTIICQSEDLITEQERIQVVWPSLWSLDEAEKAILINTKVGVVLQLKQLGYYSDDELKAFIDL